MLCDSLIVYFIFLDVYVKLSFFCHCTSRRFQNKKPMHAETQNFVSLN